VWNLVKAQWRRTSYLVLEQAKKTEQQISAAIDMINEIANTLDHDMLLRMARSNYGTMAQAMRGYLV
jgi:predicted ArsR family transcriptional regulator